MPGRAIARTVRCRAPDHRPPPVTRRDRLAFWASFAVFGALGSLWALSVPPMGGPDEPAHVVKAAAVARGEWNTTVVWRDAVAGMRVPTTRVRVPENYGLLVLDDQVACWGGQRDLRVQCAPDLPTRAGPMIRSTTYVGTYQPTYYLLVGWPSLVWPPDPGLTVMRLAGVAVVAALVASAVTSTAAGGGLLGVAGVLLAVPPAMLFLAGVVNPNAAEVAAAAALWSGLALLLADPRADRRVVARTAVAAVVLVALRPLSPAFALVIGAVVALLLADREGAAVLRRRRSVRLAATVVAAIAALTVAHVVLTGAVGSVITTESGLSRADAASEAVRAVPAWTVDQVGLLSWMGFNELHVPGPVVRAWLGAVGALVVAALVVATTRVRIGLVVLVAGVAAFPVVARAWNPDVAYQGRYVMPLAVGVPILAGFVVDRRAVGSGRVRALVLGLVASAAGAVHLVAHQALMSRNLHGFPARIFAPRRDVYWEGPFTPDLLFVGALVSSAALTALGVGLALGRPRMNGAATSSSGPTVAPAPEGSR